MTTVYTVECPNCAQRMQLEGDYSENLETPTQCGKCGWSASGYNFTYITSTIKEGDVSNGGK